MAGNTQSKVSFIETKEFANEYVIPAVLIGYFNFN